MYRSLGGLGMLPAWQYSNDPAINYKISTSPGMVYPDGVYQTTVQPIGPYYNPPQPPLQGFRGPFDSFGWRHRKLLAVGGFGLIGAGIIGGLAAILR